MFKLKMVVIVNVPTFSGQIDEPSFVDRRDLFIVTDEPVAGPSTSNPEVVSQVTKLICLHHTCIVKIRSMKSLINVIGCHLM